MEHYDLIVIGSGPGGRTAAIQAAKLNKNVLMVEKRPALGGVSVHTGTIPSKTLRETALNLSGWREREFYGRSYRVKEDITAIDLWHRLNKTLDKEVDTLKVQLSRNGVRTLHGTARFSGEHSITVESERGELQQLSADRFVISTGTTTFRPDNIAFNSKTIIDSDEILDIEAIPRSLVVIGAGVIGIEYATIFSTLDVNVTIIEPRETMLDFVDQEIVDYFGHKLRDRGLSLRFGHAVKSVEELDDGTCLTRLENGRSVRSDMVLFAAGRVGATWSLGLENIGLDADHRGRLKVNDEFQTAVPHVYAVGDVVGFPSLASTSMEQGRIAACNAFEHKIHEQAKYFPYGIYAVPEISTVGMSEEEVQQRGIPYECGVARLRETSRGQIMGLRSGLLKAIFSLRTHRLLGVHIVGEGATELIHIGQAVLTHKGKLEYFIENTFNYPTLAEGYKVAALDAWNRMRH